MDEKEQINALASELDTMIERFRDEFDLSYASVVGTLHMKITVLELEIIDQFNSEEEE